MSCAVCTMFSSSVAPGGSRVADLGQPFERRRAARARVRAMPAWSHITSRIASAATCAAPRSASGGTFHLPGAGRASASRVFVARSRATRSANTRPSSSEFDASRFAPCTPVRATSPTAYSRFALDRPYEIGHDAAHHVVRGRRHRNQIVSRIDAARLAEREDAGKALSRTPCRACARRGRPARFAARERSRAPRRRAARARRACDARFMKRSPCELTSTAPSPRTASEISASGFSGVSSAVGWNCTNSMSASVTPARCAIANPSPVATTGIRRVAIDLPAAARRQHGRVGDDLRRPPGDARAHADATPRLHDQIEHARLLEHADARRLRHARDERARHLGAGLVAVRVHDAILRVRRLAAELEPSAGIEVEVRARGLQLAHARRPFLHEHLHGGGVAERRAGGERVLPVQRRRVAGAERGGDAALRVRGGAVEQRALRQQQHVAVLAMRATRCAARRRRCRRRGIECECVRTCGKS